ncbi:hypothetical protein QBC35DRAFT_377476 [Podospora australis]|uniref:Uncharacterized protein n=1 Tax=Podospora australis TaxID=1536484 RepID=A0AAN7ALQ7_9PEZI|nr:hypothetical protein QBC35DRAFT_377476 [Podospora australis]
MTDSYARQWILVLSLTALLLSLAILAQFATRYAQAYQDAPSEVAAFLDTIESSIIENESYDHDITKVKRLEDKLRLGRLLRDIQKAGDALREDVSALVEDEGEGDRKSSRLRLSARLLWATHRRQLEERVRRLDLLRMRFLVVHMGIIANMATQNATTAKPGLVITSTPAAAARREPEQEQLPITPPYMPEPPPLPRSLADGIKSKPPLRRLTVQAMGHGDGLDGTHRTGWAGVMQELQRSPVLRERHASIELAMSRTSFP